MTEDPSSVIPQWRRVSQSTEHVLQYLFCDYLTLSVRETSTQPQVRQTSRLDAPQVMKSKNRTPW